MNAIEEALTLLAGKGSSGKEFFAVAAKALCVALEFRWASVIKRERGSDVAEILALSERGKASQRFSYPLVGAPCLEVYKRADEKRPHCFVADDVVAAFPDDPMLAELGARSYRGELFFDAEGEPAGHVFVLDDRPMVDDPQQRSFFSLVAQRVGAEFNRWQAEEAHRRTEQRLLDAIESISEGFSLYDGNDRLVMSNMSHELRTPPNAILGIAEMLQEEVEEGGHEEYAEPLSRLSRAGNHLLQLINEVLDLSKIEAGKMDLYPQEFDLVGIIEEVMTTVTPLADKNGNRLTVKCSQNVATLYADPMRVRQILLNLISNGCKFTKDGEVILWLTREAGDERDWIRFTVSDTGIGMSAEQMENLFQEFRQAEHTVTHRYGGTGLGLAIAQRLCRLMGGEIGAQSELGVGSQFTVWLPAHPPPRPSG